MTQTEAQPPANAQQANAQGLAAIRAGDGPAAVAAFTRAVAADPAALALWRNLAHAQRLSGNDTGEKDALEQALNIDRRDFGSQLRLAQLLERTGQETQALIAWSNVQALAAQQPGALAPQVEAELAAGASYCAALQARLGAAADQLIAAGTAQWDETDQRRIQAFLDRTLGRRVIFQNECSGMFYPFLPADEFFDRRQFPWFDELEAATDAIRAEALGILDNPGEAIRPYVRMEEGTPQNKWSALDQSLDWGACFLWEYGEPHQPVLDRCPATAALLSRLPILDLPGRGPSAFFSILRPHSQIPAHTGVTNTRAIIHLPLIVPPGCGFRVGGETREWVEGRAFAFDDTIEHEAWNTSDQRRVILIVDAWNPHLSLAERQAIREHIRLSEQALT